MIMKNYFTVDVETCPIKLEGYEQLPEEDKKKLINPIDSRIVAIGIRFDGKNFIFDNDDEKQLLEDFWLEWKTIKKGDRFFKIVGFNIKNFDLPFITTRSFIQNVVISPFLLKEIIDVREKINAYRYGLSRGTLKEFAELIGQKVMDVDGSDVAGLFIAKNKKKIREYLENDLVITESIYERTVQTNIAKIDRW